MYLLIKYIKSVLWRVAKRLSYIQDARCLKVNISSYVTERDSISRDGSIFTFGHTSTQQNVSLFRQGLSVIELLQRQICISVCNKIKKLFCIRSQKNKGLSFNVVQASQLARYYQALSQNGEKQVLEYSCLSVRPSAWEKLGFHWTDFHEIWYLNISLKSIKEFFFFTK